MTFWMDQLVQLGRGRVHRDRHGGELLRVHARGVRVLVQQLEVGVGQPQGAAVAGDLSGEHGAAARLQLGLGPEAVEEAHLQGARRPTAGARWRAGVVGNHDVGQRAAAGAHGPGAAGDHPGNQGDFLVERDLADGGEFAAVQVAAGEVVQQPADGGDAEVLFDDRRGTLADPALQGHSAQFGVASSAFMSVGDLSCGFTATGRAGFGVRHGQLADADVRGFAEGPDQGHGRLGVRHMDVDAPAVRAGRRRRPRPPGS